MLSVTRSLCDEITGNTVSWIVTLLIHYKIAGARMRLGYFTMVQILPCSSLNSWFTNFLPFQVLTVGPTGTGKTVVLAEKLLKGMPPEYIPNFMMFSAKTSANQTQVKKEFRLMRLKRFYSATCGAEASICFYNYNFAPLASVAEVDGDISALQNF